MQMEVPKDIGELVDSVVCSNPDDAPSILTVDEKASFEGLMNSNRGGGVSIIRGMVSKKIISRGCYKKTVLLQGEDGYTYAMKIVDLGNLSKRAKENLRRNGFDAPLEAFEKESERMQRASEASLHVSRPIAAAHMGNCYFFFEEYSENNLLNYRKNHSVLPFEVSGFVFELSSGLDNMHGIGLYHGDLHPDNILVKDTEFRRPILRITDFDVCCSMLGMDDNEKYLVPHSEIRAPEQYQDQNLDARSDIWAFGINSIFIRAGQMPFEKDFQGDQWAYENLSEAERENIRMEVYKKIMDDDHYGRIMGFADRNMLGYGPIIKKCLERDPDKRFQNGMELHEAVKSLV